MESIEASGKSVDEAVQQALARLAKRRDEVDVTVLQEPSRGAFGLGAREARVRLTVRPSIRSAVITPEMADAILGPAGLEANLDEEELYEDEEEFADDEEFLEDEEAEGDFEEVIITDESAPLIAAGTPLQFIPEEDRSTDTG
ncbi:MAG: Jag N-terminal domain-containing protein, partial [Ktedonobacteraceae bacterium]|nr:Jag N-terminal domain-containing protein [Ktedonobacteraceae bacterium]